MNASFVVGGMQYVFERGFYGLCELPILFSRIMTIHFAGMIAKKRAKTNIDDVILQAKTKREMWKNLDSYFKCLRSSGLKAALSKTKLFLINNVSDKWIEPIGKKVQDSKNRKNPDNKRDVMRILVCLGFYSTFIKIYMKIWNLSTNCWYMTFHSNGQKCTRTYFKTKKGPVKKLF